MTVKILKKTKRLTTIELDPRMAAEVIKREGLEVVKSVLKDLRYVIVYSSHNLKLWIHRVVRLFWNLSFISMDDMATSERLLWWV